MPTKGFVPLMEYVFKRDKQNRAAKDKKKTTINGGSKRETTEIKMKRIKEGRKIESKQRLKCRSRIATQAGRDAFLAVLR